MCYTVWLPDGTEVESINELEQAFGLPVDEFYPCPDELHQPAPQGQEHVKDYCLCHVDKAAYLNAVGTTWHYEEDYEGDIIVLMMPPKS